MNKLISRFTGTQDMTQGSPVSNLISFSIPLLIGNFAQQLYSTVDSIVVGKYVGDNALAAVGASFPILNLLLVLFIGISTGASIMVAQYFGGKNKELLKKTVGNTITLTLIASIVIMVLGVLITHPIMTALQTPPEIYDMSCEYLIILFLGIVGCAYYNIISGILRGMGDSITPLIFLLVACELNIGLDLLFVAAFKWGVAGVAYATIIAQAISAALCILKLIKMKETIGLDKDSLKLDKSLVFELTKLGVPSGVTQAIFSMAQIVVQNLTNSFGPAVITTSTVVMRIDGFAMMPNFTFGIAMTTYVGQNIGAGLMDRVHEGTKKGLTLGIIVSTFLTLCLLVFGKGLAHMFSNTSYVISLSVNMLRVLAVGYIAMGVTQILFGVMRGAGDTITPMWISLVTTVIIRVPIAYGIAYFTRSEELPTGSPYSLFISLLSAWVINMILAIIMYKVGAWKNKTLVKNKKENVIA